MVRVLFVCLGNICRSPMAEAVFLHKVRLAGLDSAIEADSAGTSDWNRGKPPHRGTQQILIDNQIVYAHAGRQISAVDFDRFDYILTMDENNYADVQVLQRSARATGAKQAKILRLMDYVPDPLVREVPDPYYTGGFAEVYALIEQAADTLLETICKENGLASQRE